MGESSLTGAVCRAVLLADSILDITLDWKGPYPAKLMHGTLSALDAAIKESNPLVERAAEFRARYSTPPDSIAGVSAASYHEIGRSLAMQVFWGIFHAANPLHVHGPECANLAVDIDSIVKRWADVLAYLKDQAPRFDAGRLVALIQDEAARVAPQVTESAGGPDHTTKGEIMASLSGERLAWLHRQFLDAGERFPMFHFVVRTPVHPVQGQWPVLPGLQSHD
jgi:hypothetical protein